MPIPHSHTFLPHPISPDPADSYFDDHTAGPAIYIRSSDTLARFDIDPPAHRWSAPCIGRYGSPNVDRSMMVDGQSCHWVSPDARLVAALFPTETGLTIRAFLADSGHIAWERSIPSPRLAAGIRLGPETCEAARIVPLDDILMVAILSYPLAPPPVSASLWRLDPSTGETLWTGTLAGLGDMIGLDPALDHFALHCSILEINWRRGATRLLAGPLPHPPSDPCSGRDGVYTSWHDGRGKLTVARYQTDPRSPPVLATWRRPRVKDSQVHEHNGAVLLRVNSTAAILLNPDLTPRWEARLDAPVCTVAAPDDANLLIATAGNGGSLYAFDRASGRERLRLRPARYGVSSLHCIDGTEIFAAPFAPGLLLINARTLDHAHIPLSGSPAIIGSHQGRLAAFSSKPGLQGLHILQLQ
jgi:hypothetical protein